jgi:hypothetical protein
MTVKSKRSAARYSRILRLDTLDATYALEPKLGGATGGKVNRPAETPMTAGLWPAVGETLAVGITEYQI